MPPRSVADATRFTPTGPHAFTTSNETPAERVARLRQAAREERAKKAAGTFTDRLIDRGRRVADVAHRVTAVGLIGATILCGGLTIYALTDMMMYNRRRRAEHLAANPPGPPALPPSEASATVTPLNTTLNPTPGAGPAADAATLAAARAEYEANRPKGPWEKLKGWAMSGLTPADQQIKPIFEGDTDEVVETGVGAVERKAESVKQELQGIAQEVKNQVAEKQDAAEKTGGVMSKVKGLWGGR